MTRRTPEQVAAAAEDAHAHPDDPGGELVDLSVGPAVSTVISVRLNATDLHDLEAAASAAGQRLSSYLRSSALAVAREGVPVPPEFAMRLLTVLEAAAEEARRTVANLGQHSSDLAVSASTTTVKKKQSGAETTAAASAPTQQRRTEASSRVMPSSGGTFAAPEKKGTT